MAPEVCLGKVYNTKCDIWSLAITVIEMAETKPPKSDLPPLRAMKSITSSPPPNLKDPHDWPTEMNDFISRCLIIDTYKRLHALELLDVFCFLFLFLFLFLFYFNFILISILFLFLFLIFNI